MKGTDPPTSPSLERTRAFARSNTLVQDADAMNAPRDEAELLARAREIGGLSIVELAEKLNVPLPPDPRRAKGFVGQLVERALGAGGSQPAPDFAHLGVELKTLPVDRRGRVRESTFVCVAPLRDAAESEWSDSPVRAKLARVLFVVVEADPRIPRGARRIGASFLWSPNEEQEAILRADYEELMGRLGAGELDAVDARRGRALQLRPKGQDASVRVRAFDADGAPRLARPRGFYLRARFTRTLLAAERLLPPEGAAVPLA